MKTNSVDSAGYCGYDASGERVYKLTGKSNITHLDGRMSTALVHLDDAVLYPNSYVTVTPRGYTKHHYMNTSIEL